MENKLFLFLFLISLKSFGQEFKEQYERFFSNSQSISSKISNEYGIKQGDGKVKELIVKTIKRKDCYEVLTFKISSSDKSIGMVQLTKVENYKNGKLHGYYMDAGMSWSKQGYYKNGKKHGFWAEALDTGIGESGYYKNDEKHGMWEEYTGFSSAKGKYKHGKMHGLWIMINEDLKIINEKGEEEQLVNKIYYKNGVEVKK
nr:hypothetical protein [uncultured Capnocytophaga sp.]